MIFHDIEQNTDEWLGMRAGKITSSKMGVVMAHEGKAFGDPAKKYAIDIAVERVTRKPIGSSFSNSHTERGHEQEPLAKMEYEHERFCSVDRGGFFECGDFGFSPDGLVGDSGLIEIKCHIPSQHYKNVKRGSIDPTYKWQIFSNLKFSGRKWIDYISFCQDFPEGKKIFVHSVYADECKDEFERIDRRLKEFRELINEAEADIKGIK